MFLGFPCGSAGKESTCNVGHQGSIPGFGRSPGEGQGYPLQYSGLENPMDSPWGHKESDPTERLSLSLTGGPGMGSLPANAGDTDSIPGPGGFHTLRNH